MSGLSNKGRKIPTIVYPVVIVIVVVSLTYGLMDYYNNLMETHREYVLSILEENNVKIVKNVIIDSPSIIHIVGSFDEFIEIYQQLNATTIYVYKPDTLSQYFYVFSKDMTVAWRWDTEGRLHKEGT